MRQSLRARSHQARVDGAVPQWNAVSGIQSHLAYGKVREVSAFGVPSSVASLLQQYDQTTVAFCSSENKFYVELVVMEFGLL